MLKNAAPTGPKAGWETRAIRAMEAAPSRAHPKRRAFWRRVAPVGVLAAALVVAGLWWLPRRGAFALADVAEAMAHVRSAHFVGWDPSHPSGGRDRREGWVERRRARSVEGDVIDEFFDENRMVEIRSENGSVRVTISPLPAELAKLLQDGEGYLRAFLWPQAAQDALEHRGETVAAWERQRLSDGRVVVVVDLTAGDQMTRMTVDEATDLILQIEHYRGDTLDGAIEKIEYNVDIPEEIFKVSIPEGAVVVDHTAAASSQVSGEQQANYRRWEAAAYQLQDAHVIADCPPGDMTTCGGPFHRGLIFEPVGSGGMIVAYLPDRNTYRVFGKARVHRDEPSGPSLGVVENAEFVPSTPPDVTIEQYQAEQARQAREAERRRVPPKVQAQWDVKARELTAAGAVHLSTIGDGYYDRDLKIEALEHAIHIWYLPSRKAYYIMGKARVRAQGVDQVVEDNWIKVPGPAPELPEERAY